MVSKRKAVKKAELLTRILFYHNLSNLIMQICLPVDKACFEVDKYASRLLILLHISS